MRRHRRAELGEADFQLLIDLRRFGIAVDSGPAAKIAFSARLLDKSGKVIASRLFEQSQTLDRIEPAPAVAPFNDVFGRIAKDVIGWTVQTP